MARTERRLCFQSYFVEYYRAREQYRATVYFLFLFSIVNSKAPTIDAFLLVGIDFSVYTNKTPCNIRADQHCLFFCFLICLYS